MWELLLGRQKKSNHTPSNKIQRESKERQLNSLKEIESKDKKRLHEPPWTFGQSSAELVRPIVGHSASWRSAMLRLGASRFLLRPVRTLI